MNELTKIKKCNENSLAEAPNEVLLVLDGSTGQNAYEQAAQPFALATEGNAIGYYKTRWNRQRRWLSVYPTSSRSPVKYIGIGEKIEDLRVFNREELVDSLFS